MKTKSIRRHTSSQVKTTPADNTMTLRPEKISAKKAISKVAVRKVARSSMPNIKGTEAFPKMAGGAGMNDENKLRKIRRAKQGL